jgi:hypothetical protein
MFREDKAAEVELGALPERPQQVVVSDDEKDMRRMGKRQDFRIRPPSAWRATLIFLTIPIEVNSETFNSCLLLLSPSLLSVGGVIYPGLFINMKAETAGWELLLICL